LVNRASVMRFTMPRGRPLRQEGGRNVREMEVCAVPARAQAPGS
jgi:hypothetical protein